MKKGICIAIIVLIIIIVIIAIVCLNKKGDTQVIDPSITTSQSEKSAEYEGMTDTIKAYNQSFGAKIGTDNDIRNGENVKSFISKVMKTNEEVTNENDKILLSFESWKGKAESNGSKDSTQRVYDCIGDVNSTYKLIVKEYTDDGKIKNVLIKWVSGTASEPDIPEEIDEEFDGFYGATSSSI